MLYRNCPTCKKRFSKPYNCSINYWKKRVFCSHLCKRHTDKAKQLISKGHTKEKTLYKCSFCKKEKYDHASRKYKFCSQLCFTTSNRGKPRPQSFIDKMTGHKPYYWKGGKRMMNDYLQIFIPNHPLASKAGYVAEHRLIMEKKLKRYLKKTELVHHIDFSRNNNSIDNLYLFDRMGGHTRYHNLVNKTYKLWGIKK